MNNNLNRRLQYTITTLLVVLSLVLNSCKKPPTDAPELITKITGRVVDGQTNQPLVGAQISTAPATETYLTGNDGVYTIPNIVSGQYSVTAAKEGYNSATKIITAQEGKTVNCDIQLLPIGPELSVSNEYLDFDEAQTDLKLNITNKTSIGTVTWQINYNQSWIKVSPSGGTTSTESDEVTVTVYRDSVSYGNYTGVITIFSDYGTKYINVLMTKTNPNSPQLTVIPTTLDFGNTSENAQVKIKNTGYGILNWNASTNDSWILFSSNTGSATSGNPSTLTVTLDKSALATGSYEGNIMIGSNGGNQNISVKMQVDKQSFNNPPNASFTVTPASGTTNTNFAFDASTSTDDNDPTSSLLVRWKWEDNIAFTDWTSIKTANHKYANGGDKVVALEVKDTKMKVSSCLKTLNVILGEVESNDSKLQAQEIEENSTVSGEIGYSGDTQDWYKINMHSNSGFSFSMINLNSSGISNGISGSVYLYDYNDNQLASLGSLNPGNNNTSKVYSVCGDKYYYIKVTSYNSTNSAPYKLICTDKAITTYEVGEPNNSKVDATTVNYSGEIYASIGYADDAEDWYKLKFPVKGSFSYSMTNLHESNISGGMTGSVYFYNSASNQLLSTGSLNPGNSNSSNTANVNAETYYIRVTKNNSTNSAPYRLKLNFSSN